MLGCVKMWQVGVLTFGKTMKIESTILFTMQSVAIVVTFSAACTFGLWREKGTDRHETYPGSVKQVLVLWN